MWGYEIKALAVIVSTIFIEISFDFGGELETVEATKDVRNMLFPRPLRRIDLSGEQTPQVNRMRASAIFSLTLVSRVAPLEHP